MTIPPEKRHTNFNDEAPPHHKCDQHLLAPLNWREVYQSHHIVQFYLTDDSLLDSVSRFMRAALESGAICMSIATDVHQRGIQERLEANGFDLSAYGKYIRRDASILLSHCLNNRVPDHQSLLRMVGQLTEPFEQEQAPIYIFGEMVQILWTQGNQDAAIQLETLWNDVLTTRPSLSLLCAYQMQDFAAAEHSARLGEICHQHTQVIPDEGYTTLTSSQECLSAIAQWRQKELSLSLEMTARRVAEAHLLHAENRYHHLFEASTDGIVLVNPRNGTIIDVNPSFSELLGYKREDLLNQELWQFDLFPDQEHIRDILQQVEMQQRIWYETVRFHTRYRHIHLVEIIGTLLQATPLPMIQCHVHPIADRLQMQATIQERETRFHLLANQAPFIIWQSDPGGSGSYFNPAWSSFTGLSEAQSLGTGWIQHIHPKDRRTAFTQWMQALVAHVPYSCQVRLQRANGCYCLIQIDGNPWTDVNGIFSGYIGTMKELAKLSEEDEELR